MTDTETWENLVFIKTILEKLKDLPLKIREELSDYYTEQVTLKLKEKRYTEKELWEYTFSTTDGLLSLKGIAPASFKDDPKEELK